jgi:hypothetical protein
MRGYRNGCKAAIGTPEKHSFPSPPPVGRKGPGNSDGVNGCFWELSARFCYLCFGPVLYGASFRPEYCRTDNGFGAKFKTIGLERCLAGSPHSSSAQWVVQHVIPAESKTIPAESDLILTTQVDRLKPEHLSRYSYTQKKNLFLILAPQVLPFTCVRRARTS